ncbi:MAG TPA: STAS domain-containing protein [Steroidobacteraceae bacterium]|nr:STAS domain-containing protein [Steroidobacteraceae bacterium]
MPKADAIPALHALRPGQFQLEGPLTAPHVTRLRAAGLAALAQGATESRVDLARVTTVDSAGLALLIDWQAAFQQAGHKLHFVGGPQALHALARLSDVETLIYS